MIQTKRISQKWHVLIACFISYTFDAMGMTYLSLSMLNIVKEWHIPLAKAGLLGSAILFGMGFSSIIVGYISDNYGRKKALICCLVLFGVFSGGIVFVSSWWMFMLFNFISGIGLGGIWGISASLVNETWPVEQRGKAISFVMSAGQIGFIISILLSFLFLNKFGWRFLYASSFFCVIVIIYITVFVRESEAWQLEKNKHEIGKLQKVTGKELFEKGLFRQTVLATAMTAFTFIGVWGLSTWIPSYLVSERGFENSEKTVFLIVVNICNFFGQQIWGLMSDKFGRKRTLYVLFICSTLSLIAFVLVKSLLLVYILGALVYFTMCYPSIFGVYFTELYPTRIRNLGSGFCFNIGRGISAISPFMLGQIATSYNLSVSIMTCAVFFIAAMIFLRFLPETKIS